MLSPTVMDYVITPIVCIGISLLITLAGIGASELFRRIREDWKKP